MERGIAMSEYVCPRNEKHKGVAVIELGKTTPHYGQLRCMQCSMHIKWLSKEETLTLQELQAQGELEAPVVIQCPISREPCMEESCAWWWFTESVIQGCGVCGVLQLVKVLGVALGVDHD